MRTGFAQSALFVLLALICACSSATPGPTPPAEPPAAADPQYAESLARQFCPIIHLKGDGDATENFEPEQIEIMVDEALLRDIGDPSFSEKASLSKLLQWSRGVYYLDLEGKGPDTQSLGEYQRTYGEIGDSYRPTVYARVLEGGGGDYTVVQYWFFYYFNDWRNLHEGDWELVQLCFPGYTAQQIVETGEQPVFAGYSQHQTGQRMSWTEMKEKALVSGTHPRVYVGRGSHANFFTPGQFWSVLDFDDTGLSSWRVIGPEQLDIVLLPEAEGQGERPQWLEFKGYWGEYLDFSISIRGLRFWVHGPLGPAWGEGELTSNRWEHPAEWAAALPQYPKLFWTSFFDLPGDWFTQAFFSIFSPADLHVYDGLGRHVGVNEQGDVEKEIPGALYIAPEGTQYKTIVIPEADVSQNYRLVVNGTGSGTMEIKAQVPDVENGVKRYLEYTDVPVSAATVATVDIAPEITLGPVAAESTSVRDTTTKLKLDSDGDGILELESAPGNFEREKVVLAALEAEIDIEPDAIDPGAAGEKFVTVRIELPREYDPRDIDVGTVRLGKDIPAWPRPVETVDYDRDGVEELMLRFDFQAVLDYLLREGQPGDSVPISVTGVVDGRRFVGTDSIVLRGTVVKPIRNG